MVSYKRLWIMLLEKNISKPAFREECELSTTTMTKLNKNEYVSMEILVRICRKLKCDIGDIVELIELEKNNDNR